MTSQVTFGLISSVTDKAKFKSFEFSNATIELAYPSSRMLTPHIALIGCLSFIGFIDILIGHSVGENMHIFNSVTFKLPLIHRGYGKIAPFICLNIVPFDEFMSKMDFTKSTVGIVAAVFGGLIEPVKSLLGIPLYSSALIEKQT